MALRFREGSRFFVRIIAASLAWLAIAPAVHAAQTLVYKWTARDGVTTYSQLPPKDSGMHDVQTLDIETLPADQQQAARRMLAHLQRSANAQAAATQHSFAAADQRIAVAIRALQRAEASLRTGSVPTGADRIGKVGGGSRLRASYLRRVSRLQAKVDHARQSLDAAYAARKALP